MEPEKHYTTSYENSNKNYSYTSEDKSILDCYIIIPLAKKILEFIPLWFPANMITIISNSLAWLATIIAITARRTPPLHLPIYLFIPILFFIYLIGDTLDGLHARRTKTGSPLGEFCDHFLDSFVTMELMFCIFSAHNIRTMFLISIFLYIPYIVQIGSFYEKYITKKMYFGKIGSSEAVLILSTFATIGFIPAVHGFMTKPLDIFLFGHNFTISEFALIIQALSGFSAFVQTLIRTKKLEKGFVLYLLFSLMLTLSTLFLERRRMPLIILTLSFYHIHYSASLLGAIIMKRSCPKPDIILTIAVYFILLFGFRHPVLYAILFIYILVSAFSHAAQFVHENIKYWYWINPKLSPDETTQKTENKTEPIKISAPENNTET